ncbi:MAG: YciI family protein [Mycobacteriales bacterium]
MTKFLLLTKYDADLDVAPMTEWTPEEVRRHLDFLAALNRELAGNGELVEGLALTGPELAKIVTSDGSADPVVTDGPFPEVKELLAGYQLVDVDSTERAVEIAARVSAAPGPGGVPMRQRIEVRQVMGTLPGAEL